MIWELMHMLINKYIVNEESYTSLKDETNSDEICLEIKLISISNLVVFEIENILKKYQILLTQRQTFHMQHLFCIN